MIVLKLAELLLALFGAFILARLLLIRGRQVAREIEIPTDERLVVLQRRLNFKPAFRLGQLVKKKENNAQQGRIDVIYADLDAAVDALAIPPNWYAMQAMRPLTPPSGYWYGVLLEREGAILVGELDMEEAFQ